MPPRSVDRQLDYREVGPYRPDRVDGGGSVRGELRHHLPEVLFQGGQASAGRAAGHHRSSQQEGLDDRRCGEQAQQDGAE
jgi:hypothetical protein